MPKTPERPEVAELPRCAWAVGPTTDPLYLSYHDEEWGVPVHDERRLFEMLNLEGAQAGLSWITILRRREGYRRAFAGFEPEKVARFGALEIERLLGDPGIIRNRAKIEAAIGNARALLELREKGERFVPFLWRFIGGAPRRNHFATLREVPPETPESKAMSKELKKRGFRFVGPTICYAFMQAVGMVDDHVLTCFKRQGG